MPFFARLMYRALVWKERQRARQARRASSGISAEHGQPVEGAESRTVAQAAHLETGRRGETLAYWYLRQTGYTIVARNRRAGSGGELDLVGWDGPVLAFLEVKTRSSAGPGPPESAVLQEQRRRIIRGAQSYLKKLKRKDVTYRFDIVNVLWDPGAGYRVRLTKDAFRERQGAAGQ